MTRTCCHKRGGKALSWTLYPVTLEGSDESLVSGFFTTEYTSWTENTTCPTSSLRRQDSGLWSTRVWRLGWIAVCARRWVEGVLMSKYLFVVSMYLQFKITVHSCLYLKARCMLIHRKGLSPSKYIKF